MVNGGNTNEGARVLEGLARLHGLNEEARQKKTETNVTINQQNNTLIQNGMDAETLRKKMETMDEKQLLEQAGTRFDGVDLEPKLIVKEETNDLDQLQRSERDKVLVGRTTESEGEAEVLPTNDDPAGER